MWIEPYPICPQCKEEQIKKEQELARQRELNNLCVYHRLMKEKQGGDGV